MSTDNREACAMPGDVSSNMPAAELSPEEREEFYVWRKSREAIARALADVEGYPEAEHYALADDVLLALTTADLVIWRRAGTDDYPPPHNCSDECAAV